MEMIQGGIKSSPCSPTISCSHSRTPLDLCQAHTPLIYVVAVMHLWSRVASFLVPSLDVSLIICQRP